MGGSCIFQPFFIISGTQKYVHKSCLREWQKTVLRSNLGDGMFVWYSLRPVSLCDNTVVFF